jgi:dTDP-glucose 4,6-dehydratase
MSEDYYEQLWRSNVVGTKNLLRLQERLRFKVVFASTSEVYGDVSEPMSEELMDAKEIRQLNDYAMSKWVNEQQIMNSASMFGTETVRVRLFNTYGPGEYFTPYTVGRSLCEPCADEPWALRAQRCSISVC